MQDPILLPFVLLFDGGAASGAAAGAAEGGATAGNQSDGQTTGGEAAPAAGEQTTTTTNEPETPEAKRQRYKDMISGEMRDMYQEDMDRIVRKRIAKPTAQIAAQKPIMDLLAQRYGITDGDIGKLQQALEADQSMWEQQAQDAGFPSVENYMAYKRMEREVAEFREQQATEQQRAQAQAQVNDWLAQAEGMQMTYPGFDLQAEIAANPKFLNLLQAGIPVQHAYEVLHMDAVKAQVANQSAADAERRVTDNIRAKGARPAEAGATAGTALNVQTNVHAMTAQQRRELIERARRGERVTLTK